MTKYGPGDEITWPACTGHPLDPRTPIQSTWRCARCHTIRHITSGWRFIGAGRDRRRICHECWEARCSPRS